MFFYTVTDAATASGASPEFIADEIRNAILSGEKDIILSSYLPIALYWVRFLCPSLYFWVMEKRARRLKATA